MKKNIVGIQQIGIGIPNVHEAFAWYRRNFGMDIPVFEEAAEANLMLPYTGGKPHQRHAILAINMKGGGGFEIWQYTSRTPQPAGFELQLGDLGIYCARIKTDDIQKAFAFLRSRSANIMGAISKAPDGSEHFFVKDPYGNLFDVVRSDNFFSAGKHVIGGPEGCMIGVTDLEKSKKFYKEILGYDTIVYEKEGAFEDLKALPSGNNKAQRALLTHSKLRTGSFSKLLGKSNIELVKVAGRTPKKIFENRFWGDRGFIHLCFDVTGMNEIKKECEKLGHPFTVDSGERFDMGEAAGRFSYIEDPDGTLIEFVETHKIPIFKKIGLYLNLKKRDPEKPLADLMLKAMALNRVKD